MIGEDEEEEEMSFMTWAGPGYSSDVITGAEQCLGERKREREIYLFFKLFLFRHVY